MTDIRLPDDLREPGDDAAVATLRRYYGPQPGERGFFTGSLFDTWDSTGTRFADHDRFTADDLVAVTFLSVEVPPVAAELLLRSRARAFAELLAAVKERDLASCPEPLGEDSPEWRLDAELKGLPGVGPTTASKLFARKRPRLRPIFDTVVGRELGTETQHWDPIRRALIADDGALHDRLERLRGLAGLPEEVTALRVLDVLAWMQGRRSAA
jgi:hypothetical protein